MLELRVLGPLEVWRDGQALALPGAASRRLLAALALRAGRWVSTERLIDEVWGAQPPASARKALQMHVSRLRGALAGDAGILLSGPHGYRLALAPEQFDAARFERLSDEGRRALAESDAPVAHRCLTAALALWRGPPLDGLGVLEPEVARLEEARLVALEQRIDADLLLGRHIELVGELQQLVGEQRWRERFHAQLMIALYRSGRQSDALDAYRRARAAFAEELGIEPGAVLRDLEGAILRHDRTLDAPPVIDQPAAALPPAATPLFGRAADIDHIVGALADSRVLTLIGPGGVGKTRLAIAVARAAAERFSAGARVAWLAPVARADGVAAALAAAIDAQPTGGESVDAALVRRLTGQELLLVVDNCEHVLDAAPLLSMLLAQCPRLTLLATSREPLRLTVERCVPIAPLPPGAAVELFKERAAMRDPHVALDVDDALDTICRRLDGLPLAIELAAGRVGLLTPRQLADRLADALPLLADGPRDLAARQQTMRATLDWSYELLDATEQRALAALGAFIGGSTLEAAEAVTQAPITVLHSLVTRNLAYVDDGRIGLLEVVRQYAAQRLHESADATDVRVRHARWYLERAQREERDVLILRPRPRARLAQMYGNVAGALRWAVESEDAALAHGLVGALGQTWIMLSRRDEGVRWTDAALALNGAVPERERGRALLTRELLGWAWATPQAQSLAGVVEMLQAAGDAEGVCRALCSLVEIYSGDGNWEHAGLHARQAREVAAGLHPYELGRALTVSAIASRTLPETREFADRAVAVLQPLGALADIAHMRSAIGWLGLLDADYPAAEAQLREAMQAAAAGENLRIECLALGNLGLAVLFQDRLAEAEQHFRRQLTLAMEGRATVYYGEALFGLATVAAETGEDVAAATLYGSSRALALRAPNTVEARVYDRCEARFLDPVRGRLGAAWEVARADGHARATQDPRGFIGGVLAHRD